jgi:hypothetical protein
MDEERREARHGMVLPRGVLVEEEPKFGIAPSTLTAQQDPEVFREAYVS